MPLDRPRSLDGAFGRKDVVSATRPSGSEGAGSRKTVLGQQGEQRVGAEGLTSVLSASPGIFAARCHDGWKRGRQYLASIGNARRSTPSCGTCPPGARIPPTGTAHPPCGENKREPHFSGWGFGASFYILPLVV